MTKKIIFCFQYIFSLPSSSVTMSRLYAALDHLAYLDRKDLFHLLLSHPSFSKSLLLSSTSDHLPLSSFFFFYSTLVHVSVPFSTSSTQYQYTGIVEDVERMMELYVGQFGAVEDTFRFVKTGLMLVYVVLVLNRERVSEEDRERLMGMETVVGVDGEVEGELNTAQKRELKRYLAMLVGKMKGKNVDLDAVREMRDKELTGILENMASEVRKKRGLISDWQLATEKYDELHGEQAKFTIKDLYSRSKELENKEKVRIPEVGRKLNDPHPDAKQVKFHSDTEDTPKLSKNVARKVALARHVEPKEDIDLEFNDRGIALHEIERKQLPVLKVRPRNGAKIVQSTETSEQTTEDDHEEAGQKTKYSPRPRKRKIAVEKGETKGDNDPDTKHLSLKRKSATEENQESDETEDEISKPSRKKAAQPGVRKKRVPWSEEDTAVLVQALRDQRKVALSRMKGDDPDYDLQSSLDQFSPGWSAIVALDLFSIPRTNVNCKGRCRRASRPA